MDVASRMGAAIAARLQAMSAGARLLVGFMGIVAVLSVAMLGSPPAAGPDMLLLGGEALPPDQLSRVEAAFARAGLSDYRIDAGRVRIASQRNAAYMAALAAADALPPNFSEILDKPLREASPLMSRAQQEESIKIARQQALASIIQSMKGVQRAQVLYDRERRPGLAGGQNITASVTVKMQPGEELQPPQIEALRKLLAGAIAGLEPQNVAVIDLGSGRSFPLNPTVPDESARVQAAADTAVERLRGGIHDAVTQSQRRRSTTPAPLQSDIDTAPFQSVALAWEWARQHARPLGLGGLALAAVVVLGAITRKQPVRVPAAAQPSEEETAAKRPPLEAIPAAVAADVPASDLPQMKEPRLASAKNHYASLPPAAGAPRTRRAERQEHVDLDTIVRDDPGAAARILRQWIGSTS